MKRVALLLTLGAAACASDGGRGPDGPPLRLRADPSAVVAAEIGFNQLAQAKGQWTAFRETAADGAEMFVPERVAAAIWLNRRADPSIAVKWQPHAVWSSCDGSYAVTRGAWERPGSAGSYVTVWERQKNGKHKWLVDMSLADERPAAVPEMVAARVANCRMGPAQRAALEAAEAASPVARNQSNGSAKDSTLTWITRSENGKRSFMLQFWNGKEFETVLDTAAGAQPR